MFLTLCRYNLIFIVNLVVWFYYSLQFIFILVLYYFFTNDNPYWCLTMFPIHYDKIFCTLVIREIELVVFRFFFPHNSSKISVDWGPCFRVCSLVKNLTPLSSQILFTCHLVIDQLEDQLWYKNPVMQEPRKIVYQDFALDIRG